MRDRMEQILLKLGLKRSYVGFDYLLKAAELREQDGPLGPALVYEVAEALGKPGSQVYRGLTNAARYLNDHSPAARALGDCCRGTAYDLVTGLVPLCRQETVEL